MIAIDPGTTHSGFVILSKSGTVTTSMVIENSEVLTELNVMPHLPVAIEMI